jgi:anti-sigma B factor antagonist
MKLEITAHSPEITVVRLAGDRLDAAAALAVKQELIDLIDAGHSVLAVDLTQVNFIDSSGLGALISALKRVPPQGDMVVFGLTPAVAALFELTRMNRVFFPYASQADAMEYLTAFVQTRR